MNIVSHQICRIAASMLESMRDQPVAVVQNGTPLYATEIHFTDDDLREPAFEVMIRKLFQWVSDVYAMSDDDVPLRVICGSISHDVAADSMVMNLAVGTA